MSRLRNLLFWFAAISLAIPSAWSAVTISDAQVTNIGTTSVTAVWRTSELSTPVLDVFSDSAGTNSLNNSVGFEFYPIARGDVAIVNDTSARASRRDLELLASNRLVVAVRVTGLIPGTTYYFRPRSFANGVENGAGVVALIPATTAQFSSLISDARILRVRFPLLAATGMVALLQGPSGTTALSTIVGDSTDANSALFLLPNVYSTSSGTNAAPSAPQQVAVRVIGQGAPTGTFTGTVNFGTTFNVAKFETLDADLASPAPVFTTHPANQSAQSGATATFTVAASGDPAPGFKWQRKPAGSDAWADLTEGAPYSGVATVNLSVTGTTLAMSGDQFRAIASNGVPPDATSNAANLTVTLVTSAPQITTQPLPASVVAGSNATFTVAAAGTPTPTIQWQWKPASSNTWSDLVNGPVYSGVTTNSLTVTATTLAMNGDQFRALASNSVASGIQSTEVTLSVSSGNVAPTITTQPQATTVIAGANASFTVAASGTPTPNLQWQRKPAGSGTWSNLTNTAPYSGVTTTTLTITATTLAMSGDEFRAIASNGTSPDAPSNAAALTVNPPAVAPVITTHPSSASVNAGANVTFTGAASGTPAPVLKWQWKPAGSSLWTDLVNGAVYSGVNTSALTVTGATAAMSGDQFRLVASNGVLPDASSNAATLNVAPVIVPPVTVPPAFTANPGSVTVLAGASATFNVSATGMPLPGYRWQRNAGGIGGWSDLGVTGTTLTISGTTVAMSGDQFRAIASNGIPPDAISGAATLTVNPAVTAPAITTQPASQTVNANSNVTFSVAATGTTLAYRWLKNGSPIAGASSSSLTLANVQSGDAGTYSVVVSNEAGTVTSAGANLTVNVEPTAPVIEVQPVSGAFRPGASIGLSVTARGSAPLTYQWFKNRAPLSGATSPTLMLTNANNSTAGSYYVVVRNSAGSVTSQSAVLSVHRAGAYFGSLGANGGVFALYVHLDGTATFLGFAKNGNIPIVSSSLVVGPDGSFGGGARSAALSAATVGGTPPRAAAETSFAIQGRIGDSGALTGSISGLDLSFSAPPAATSGSTASVAGFYQAGAVGASAVSYTIVGAAGEAFVMTVSGTAADAGKGTITETGQLAVTTESNAKVGGTIQASTATMSATVTSASGGTLTFIGANNLVRTDVEKLVNVATRTQAGAGSNTLIAGFSIRGDTAKPVLVRAIGPSLAGFNVPGALSAARLEVFRDQTSLAVGNNWGASANASLIAATASRVGAFVLANNSRDAALLLTLEPGTYTAVVSGQDGATGIALVEVYDASEGEIPPSERIVNVSTRAVAGTAENTLIAGFAINGTVPKRVLIRGAGPSLAQFGVSGVLARPQLTVFSGNQVVAQNAGWGTSPDSGMIAATASDVGAFAFAANSLDSALILNLEPGSYTAQVTGVNGTTGVALVEVYEVP